MSETTDRQAGRVAVITGTSRGIGPTTAARVVAEGGQEAAWITGQVVTVDGGSTLNGGI